MEDRANMPFGKISSKEMMMCSICPLQFIMNRSRIVGVLKKDDYFFEVFFKAGFTLVFLIFFKLHFELASSFTLHFRLVPVNAKYFGYIIPIGIKCPHNPQLARGLKEESKKQQYGYTAFQICAKLHP